MSDQRSTIQKDDLRREFRARRHALSGHEHARASAELEARLLEHLAGCRAVALYASTQNEISVDDLAETLRGRGVETFYPRVVGPGVMVFARVEGAEELEEGRFGIRAPGVDAPPADVSALDAVLVPAVAFDLRGARIGFGGGYYDRALAGTHVGAPRLIGVGYDWQVHDEVISVEHHDVCVDLIVTDLRTIDCR